VIRQCRSAIKIGGHFLRDNPELGGIIVLALEGFVKAFQAAGANSFLTHQTFNQAVLWTWLDATA